jgi:hypothetical protein
MIKLKPGDKVYFIQNDRKLRGEVADTLSLKSRGEVLRVPVIRRFNRKNIFCNADRPTGSRVEPKVRWLLRTDLRKLPEPKAVVISKKRKAKNK